MDQPTGMRRARCHRTGRGCAHPGRVPPGIDRDVGAARRDARARTGAGISMNERKDERMSERMKQLPITLTVNGENREFLAEPRKLLSDALREDCGLTGTHVGCEHGVCGACTVLVDGAPARSCLLYAVQAQGNDIKTIEAFGADGKLSPVQQ